MDSIDTCAIAIWTQDKKNAEKQKLDAVSHWGEK